VISRRSRRRGEASAVPSGLLPGPGREGLLPLDLVAHVLEALLELGEAPADAPADVGEPPPEEEEGHDEDQDELEGTDLVEEGERRHLGSRRIVVRESRPTTAAAAQ
jgi:hypothetical protein